MAASVPSSVELWAPNGRGSHVCIGSMSAATTASFQGTLPGKIVITSFRRNVRERGHPLATLTPPAGPQGRLKVPVARLLQYLKRGLGQTAGRPKAAESDDLPSGMAIVSNEDESEFCLVRVGAGRSSAPAVIEADETTSEVYTKDAPAKVVSKRDYLFGDLPQSIRDNMLLDDVALYSVTPSWQADKQSRLLLDYVGADSVVTDCCACVGGNVISFAKYFKFVNAVEYSRQRARLLQHNVSAAGVGPKTKVLCGDFMQLFTGLKQTVAFCDPPWGGPEYKNAVSLDLSLGKTPMHIFCRALRNRCEYVYLKLPKNFNQDGLEERTQGAMVLEHRLAEKNMLLLLYRTIPTLDGQDDPQYVAFKQKQEAAGSGQGSSAAAGAGAGAGAGANGRARAPKRGRDDAGGHSGAQPHTRPRVGGGPGS